MNLTASLWILTVHWAAGAEKGEEVSSETGRFAFYQVIVCTYPSISFSAFITSYSVICSG